MANATDPGINRAITILLLLGWWAAAPLQAAIQDADSSSVGRRDAKTSRASTASRNKELTTDARLAFIQKAQIWAPTNIPEMDLRAGPRGRGALQPNEMVTCDYVEAKLPGTSLKFNCAIRDGDVVKVRYGSDNGEVQGQVLASRLLWALGFAADGAYPVRVTCRGCSPDPWTQRASVPGEQLFDPVTIERNPPGKEMRYENRKLGWSWPELDFVDERQGGAPKAQRDALTLLAVLMQHHDNKAGQQRLLCLKGGLTDDGTCSKPFMMLHDVGRTFGRANFLYEMAVGSVNFDEWSKAPIWRDAPQCVGHLSRSVDGTLADPTISEAGRQFLAGLIVQLTDQQLRDLFEVARVDRRSRKPDGPEPPASVDEWVAAFKHKRDEIVTHHCQS